MGKEYDFYIENGVLKEYCGFDEHVTIPDGVEKIRNHAFGRTGSIRKVVIPDSMRKSPLS